MSEVHTQSPRARPPVYGRNGRHKLAPKKNIPGAITAGIIAQGVDPNSPVGKMMFDREWNKLPRGDIPMANCLTRRAKVPALRVVDRRIWAKLDQAARGRYFDRLKEELA